MRFVLDGFVPDYETLINKTNRCSREVKRLRSLALEVFHSLNNLNPSYLKNMFSERSNARTHKNVLYFPTQNTVTCALGRIRALNPHI